MTHKWLTALLLCTPMLAAAQSPDMPCEAIDHLPPARLSGLWQLRLWPEGGTESAAVSSGALKLERHPEFAGSVRGDLKRSERGSDLSAVVVGDVVDGEFHLEESADGVRMEAIWSGTPEDCGQTLRGTRRPAEGRPAGEPVLRFSLKKTPGWR